MWRRVLAGFAGTLVVLASGIAFFYAMMATDDFQNPNASLWAAILGIAIMWLLAFGALGMGIHYLKYSLTGEFLRLNPWARAFFLGALSFFPGFILTAPMAIVLAQKRWPGDTRADNVAMLASLSAGAVSAIIVFLALVRKARQANAATFGAE